MSHDRVVRVPTSFRNSLPAQEIHIEEVEEEAEVEEVEEAEVEVVEEEGHPQP